jgi:hypothetical protein
MSKACLQIWGCIWEGGVHAKENTTCYLILCYLPFNPFKLNCSLELGFSRTSITINILTVTARQAAFKSVQVPKGYVAVYVIPVSYLN